MPIATERQPAHQVMTINAHLLSKNPSTLSTSSAFFPPVSRPLLLIHAFSTATVSYHTNRTRQPHISSLLARTDQVYAYLANGVLVIMIFHLLIADAVRRTRGRSVRFGLLCCGAAILVGAGCGGSLDERGCGPAVFTPDLVLLLQLDTPVNDVGSSALRIRHG